MTTSECSSEVTERIVKGLTDRLAEGLKAFDEVTTLFKRPFRIKVSYGWITVHPVTSDKNRVASIHFRITSVFCLKKGEVWEEFPGYSENFRYPINESVDQSDGKAFKDVFDGVIYILHKILVIETASPR
jgi:hypothetical protein